MSASATGRPRRGELLEAAIPGWRDRTPKGGPSAARSSALLPTFGWDIQREMRAVKGDIILKGELQLPA
ncbi:MAG: hypothetical protein WBX14_06005, partial [Candidatus Udaeobacter sp.]